MAMDALEQEYGTLPPWAGRLREAAPGFYGDYLALRGRILRHGVLSRKEKDLLLELVLVAINLAEGYEEGIRLHAGNARRMGAGDGHLVETALTVVLTAGSPAWFNVVPHLEAR